VVPGQAAARAAAARGSSPSTFAAQGRRPGPADLREGAQRLSGNGSPQKAAAQQAGQQIKDEYQAWARRRLDDVTLDYLFLDASFFRMHPGSPAEPVLAAWGITTEGKPAFVGLAPGAGESADAWHDFLQDLKDRGLASPLLVISDGAPGLISAIEQAYPRTLRQRCLVHRCRNILSKIPAGMQAEVKDAYWAIFDTGDLATPARPQAGGDHRRPHHRDGRQVRRHLPLGDEMPDH